MRISDHIENAEPVTTGGHVYKALRSDGHHSAVQVFPFQLNAEGSRFFTEQVKLLSEIYIEYRATIPKVWSHGFTKTGSFPFIEWEWLDGPDLTQHQPLPLDSIINIAEEISRAMAYCHNLDLIHGNIKSSSILWSEKQKHYVLTGFRFGLHPTREVRTKTNLVAVISPEQNAAKPSIRNDVKSIGRLLMQLLTGKDFHTADDLEELRRRYIPAEWNEKPVPQWFISCIERSIGVSKEEAFEHAGELHHYILEHHKLPFQKKEWYRSKPQSFAVVEPRPPLKMPRFSRKNLKLLLPSRFRKSEELRFVFDRNIAAGLIIAALLLGFSLYAQKKEKLEKRQMAERRAQPAIDTSTSVDYTTGQDQPSIEHSPTTNANTTERISKKEKPVQKKTPVVTIDSSRATSPNTTNSNELGSYKVKSKAYFHNAPNESTRRNAFIVHWNNAVLHPTKEENGFVYVIFTNDEGQTSKDWLKKSDLIRR